MATDQRIEFPNCDPQELALHDDGFPPTEPHRLLSPCRFEDAQSDFDNSDEEIIISTDEVEVPNVSSRGPDSATTECPVMNEEQAKIIDQGIDVHFYAPRSPSRPKVLEHMNISEFERENFMKTCFKRSLRCLRHEVAGCNIAMQLGGWVPVSEAIRGLSKEFRDHNSQNHKRSTFCVFLNTRAKGFSPTPTSHTPEFQSECVEKGYPPDNPETPDIMDNSLILNLRQVIPFYGYAKDPYVRDYAHARWSRNDTQREALCESAEPSVVHNRSHPGQSRHPAKLRILRKHKQDENSLRWFEVVDSGHQF